MVTIARCKLLISALLICPAHQGSDPTVDVDRGRPPLGPPLPSLPGRPGCLPAVG